ncbi:MAG: glycosyltransferase family 2 protein [Vibrionaceae bacterium]
MSEIVVYLTVISMLLIVYHHAIFPPLMHLLSHYLAKRRDEPRVSEPRELPFITIVVPAFNEADFIAQKIANLAALDYPKERYQVVLACDGCTDLTEHLARATHAQLFCHDLSLRIVSFAENRGKVAVLNDVMATLDCEIVAFSDVSALVSVDALQLAAAHFAAPQIGGVSSRYSLLYPNPGEQEYWRYQNKIQASESRIGSMLGAHGSLYFIRRRLFKPLPLDTINDDFIVPMKVIEQGYEVILDENIISLESQPSTAGQDFRRRLRIGAGNLQQLMRLWRCLLPKYGAVAYTFASGKALRPLVPIFMLCALLGSFWLVGENWFFTLALLAQVQIYALAFLVQIGCLQTKNKLLKAIHYLVAGHVANFLGGMAYLVGFFHRHWHRV